MASAAPTPARAADFVDSPTGSRRSAGSSTWPVPRGTARSCGPRSRSATRRGSDDGRPSGFPAHLVVALELAPERDLGVLCHANVAHERLDLGPGLLEEPLKALGVGPLVDHHDLAILG